MIILCTQCLHGSVELGAINPPELEHYNRGAIQNPSQGAGHIFGERSNLLGASPGAFEEFAEELVQFVFA